MARSTATAIDAVHATWLSEKLRCGGRLRRLRVGGRGRWLRGLGLDGLWNRRCLHEAQRLGVGDLDGLVVGFVRDLRHGRRGRSARRLEA